MPLLFINLEYLIPRVLALFRAFGVSSEVEKKGEIHFSPRSRETFRIFRNMLAAAARNLKLVLLARPRVNSSGLVERETTVSCARNIIARRTV